MGYRTELFREKRGHPIAISRMRGDSPQSRYRRILFVFQDARGIFTVVTLTYKIGTYAGFFF